MAFSPVFCCIRLPPTFSSLPFLSQCPHYFPLRIGGLVVSPSRWFETISHDLLPTPSDDTIPKGMLAWSHDARAHDPVLETTRYSPNDTKSDWPGLSCQPQQAVCLGAGNDHSRLSERCDISLKLFELSATQYLSSSNRSLDQRWPFVILVMTYFAFSNQTKFLKNSATNRIRSEK